MRDADQPLEHTDNGDVTPPPSPDITSNPLCVTSTDAGRAGGVFPYTLHCTGERCETGNDVQQQQQLLQVDNTPICQVCYYMTLSIHSRNKLTSVNESRAITN